MSRAPAKAKPSSPLPTNNSAEPIVAPYANISPLTALPTRSPLLDIRLPEMPEMTNVIPPALEPLPSLPLPNKLVSNTAKVDALKMDFKQKRNRKSLFPDVIENY